MRYGGLWRKGGFAPPGPARAPPDAANSGPLGEEAFGAAPVLDNDMSDVGTAEADLRL